MLIGSKLLPPAPIGLRSRRPCGRYLPSLPQPSLPRHSGDRQYGAGLAVAGTVFTPSATISPAEPCACSGSSDMSAGRACHHPAVSCLMRRW
jgi:hypothetical protein